VQYFKDAMDPTFVVQHIIASKFERNPFDASQEVQRYVKWCGLSKCAKFTCLAL
jgi:hypothetical protein